MQGPDQNPLKGPSITTVRLENFRPISPIGWTKQIKHGRFAFQLLEEKYGRNFIDEYKEREVGARFEDEEGKVDIPDELTEESLPKISRAFSLSRPTPSVLLEIEDLTIKMARLEKISDIMEFARKELGLTEQQVEDAAKKTLESLEEEFIK